MKSGLRLLILCLIFLLGLSAVMAQDAPPTLTVNTRTLNVRGGAGTGFAIIKRIRRGEQYPIIGRNNAATWWQIDINGTTGWVSGRYVTTANTATVPVIGENACVPVLAPACPNEQTTTIVTSQRFEHGLMLWRSDNHEIYVLTDDGIFLNYVDAWSGQALTTETPPAGLLQPQNGFGYLWQTDARVRERLGWAVTGESAYTTPVERWNGTSPAPSDDTLYLRLPDGRAAGLNYYADVWR